MFEPTDQRHKHAIREAVFAVLLAQPLTPDQLQRFIAFGKTLTELPSNQFLQQLFPLPPAFPLEAVSGFAGSAFQSFKPDGTLSWRLLVQQNQITVNCLDYESWEAVWPRAKSYLTRTLDLFAGDVNVVVNIQLQYINAFHWRGDDQLVPDFGTLLNRRSERIPAAFWERSSREWHVHQGWFEESTSLLPGKILRREHLTSQLEQNIGLTVMVDLMDRNDLRDPMPVGTLSNSLDDIFQSMRRRLRASLRDYLNEKVCIEIGAVPLS